MKRRSWRAMGKALQSLQDMKSSVATSRLQASLEESTDLVSGWLDLDPRDRESAVDLHLSSLDTASLELLKGHLGIMQDGLAEGLREHRTNEAAFAAGRYYEDQVHYLRLRAMGAPPDAAWVSGLESIEATVRDVERIRSQVESASRNA